MSIRITPASAAKTGYKQNLVFVDWFRGGKTPAAIIKPALQGAKYCGALLVMRDGTLPFYDERCLKVGRKTPTHCHLFPNRNAAKAYVKNHFSREFDGSYSNWKEGCPVWSGQAEEGEQDKGNKYG